MRKVLEGGLTSKFLSRFPKYDPNDSKNWDDIGTLFKTAKLVAGDVAKNLKMSRDDLWHKLKSEWGKVARREGGVPDFLQTAIGNVGGWGDVTDAIKKASSGGNYDELEDLLMVGALPDIDKIIDMFKRAHWEVIV